MGKTWCVIAAFLVFIVFECCDAKSVSNGVNPVILPAQQSPEDIRRLYAALQRQAEEETEYRNYLDQPRRIQLGTVKTRRAPSVEGFEWEGMMQAMDNIRKPRFGRR